jgi:hypothetical protein
LIELKLPPTGGKGRIARSPANLRVEDLNMTMLMQTRDPFERAPSAVERRDSVRESAAEAHLAMIKRFCVGALTVLAAGGALATIIALKAALFLWVFHYY